MKINSKKLDELVEGRASPKKPMGLLGFISQKNITRVVMLLVLFAGVAMALVWDIRARTEATLNGFINYQAKLTDATNIPVADGSYNLRFRLCTGSTCVAAGDPVWTETLDYNGGAPDRRVAIANGFINVLLGQVSSLLAVDFNKTLYLEVAVGGSTTSPSWQPLSPTKQIGVVPSAFTALSLGGKTEDLFALLAGRAGGQTLVGGTAADGTLILQGNSTTGNTATNANIQFNVGESGVTTAMTILNNGNLGIGTITPTANLQVAQGTVGVGTITTSGTAVTGVGTQFLNTFKVGNTIVCAGQTKTIATITTNTALTTDAWSPDIAVATAYTLTGGTRFSVLGNGNVGIGTTVPNQLLVAAKSDGVNPVILKVQNLYGGPGSAGTKLILGTSATITTDTVGSELFAIRTETGGAGSTDLAFSTSLETTMTERMRILANGNAGIGTIAPQSLLDVRGVAGAAGILTLATQELTVIDGDVLGKINFNAPLESAGTDAIAIGASIAAVAEGTFSASSNATELIFYTGASETATQKMVISSAGNLGIGTITPTANLQVAQGTVGVGTITTSGTAVTGVGTQFLNTFKVGNTIVCAGQTKTIATITTNTALTTDAWSPDIAVATAYTLTGGTRFSVLGNGNIGIGTPSPTELLHIRGTTSKIWLENSDTATATDLNANTPGLLLTTKSNTGATYFGPALMFGSTDIDLTTENPKVLAGIQLTFGQNLNDDTDASGGLAFFTSGINAGASNVTDERMRIDRAGNVGIGTVTPQSALQIGTSLDATLNYFQIDTLNADTAGAALASGDCDAAAEVGRMIVSTRYTATAEYKIWVCTQTGAATFAWKSATLS